MGFAQQNWFLSDSKVFAIMVRISTVPCFYFPRPSLSFMHCNTSLAYKVRFTTIVVVRLRYTLVILVGILPHFLHNWPQLRHEPLKSLLNKEERCLRLGLKGICDFGYQC